jgi:hypothetical protein
VHDLGVETESGVEREVAVVGQAEPDPAASAGPQSNGSAGSPTARTNTLVDPPGTTASAGRSALGPSVSSPLTTSLTVPSPPSATTTSSPSRIARTASAAACPRWLVSATSTFISLASARLSTSRLRGVEVVAAGLTTRRARTLVTVVRWVG